MIPIGISSACCYPRPVEETVWSFCDHGVSAVELFLNTDSEFSPQFLKPLKERMDAAGMRVLSVHPFTAPIESLLFFSDYDRRFQDGLELLRRFGESLHLLEAPILVLHGCLQQNAAPDERVFERFARMRDVLREQGVILAQENVAPYRSHSLDFLQRMEKTLDGDVSFVLDVKQAVRAGEDPLRMAEALGPKIVHLHLSDHAPGQDCLPIGSGDFDFDALFGVLKRRGFCGSGVLELYRSNYQEESQLYASMKRLQASAEKFFEST